jgi:hypothetical protein
MAKFNRDAFERANEAAKESGSFEDVSPGIYICKLHTCEFKPSKKADSKSEQVAFGWQIDKDDEKFAGQMFWWNQTVKNRDGEENEIGLQQLCRFMHQLSEGTFNDDEFFMDPDSTLEKFKGTVARLKVDYAKDDDPNSEYGRKYKFFVQRVKDRTYSPNEVAELEKEGETPETPTVEDDGKSEVIPGESIVGWNDAKLGKTRYGKVISLMDDPTGGENGFLQVSEIDEQTLQPKGKEILTLLQSQCQMVEVEDGEEEIVEEEETQTEPELKVGATIKYNFNGKDHTDTVKEIQEDTGKVIVHASKNGKKVKRTLDITKVTVETPF